MKKTISLILILSMIISGLMIPAAHAEDYVSVRTTLSGSSSGKINNVKLAANAINGTRVAYGESFSFNDVVGPRTKSYGYVSAKNGRGAKVTGGGVSQVASTLYLALRDVEGDIAFGDIRTYGSRFADNYVSRGDLAVITDYSAGTDFKFTNLAEDMVIEMWTNENYLYCTLTLGGGTSSGNDFAVDWGSGWDSGFTSESTGQVIASASIYCGEESGVLTNVRNAANCIQDTTLNNGGRFSFNDVVGPRTEKYGYVSGTNGRGVKVNGGGVAQVASVLWLAIKDRGDFAILEKNTYGGKYNQSYVSNSADAILTDYKAGTDFSFRYTGNGSVTLYTWLDGNVLKCEIRRN